MAGLGLGCAPKAYKVPLLPSGKRKDPDFAQGHRLLKPNFASTPSRSERFQAVILGGGISGLSAAWRWRHAGLKRFVLLELESEVGGNSRALSYPASAAPIGAHYLTLPNLEASAVRRLLKEMNVLGKGSSGKLEINPDELCFSPQERLFYQGNWYESLLPEELLDEEALRQARHFSEHVISWQGRRDAKGRKVFALPLAFSSPNHEFTRLDQVSFAEYADSQGWTHPLLRWYLEYGCRDDFGGSLENCSAWAGLHYFCSRDGGGLGNPDRYLVWPEGNNRLVKHLKAKVGSERLRSGSLVIAVKPGPKGVAVDYVELATNERVRLEADLVVYCLPTFTRPYLLEGEAKLQGFQYPPWITANLSLSKPPKDRQGSGFIAWDNVLYGAKSLGYVVSTHQQAAYDPLRPTVWTWYRPFIADSPAVERKRLLEARWEDWAKVILDELESVHPDIREVCERLDITVLGHGMIRPSLGFTWGEEIQKAREPLGRIFFGHGDLSGMSIFEESQYRGVLAAEKALAYLGMSVESFL